jgi:hypothetical protein
MGMTHREGASHRTILRFWKSCPAFMANTPALSTSILLFLGPNNVRNMASAAETKLTGTLYNVENKRFTWETYVRIHTEQYSVLKGLKDYSYSGIGDSSKVRHLLKGIKTPYLDVCKMQVMASPNLRDDSAATVELYSPCTKQMKVVKPHLNVSEVSFAPGKVGNNSFGKRGSSRISNVSKDAVDDSFFEKHEYHALTPEKKNTLRLKRLKRVHVGNVHGRGVNGNGKGNGKGPTLKSLNRSIAALATKFDKFNFPNDDDDDYDDDDDDDDDDDNESSDEKEGSSNRSNAARPAKARRRSVEATETQIFQLSRCAWDLLAQSKKVTYWTLTQMQTVLFVGRRFWYLMILIGR